MFYFLPLLNIEWSFSLFLFPWWLTYATFFTRCLCFYHKWWWGRGKNQFFKYFLRILIKFEEKVLEIDKHCWLLITWRFKKLNSIQSLWRHFRNQSTLTTPFCTKFTFDNSNSPCLEHFLLYPNNCLVRL